MKRALRSVAGTPAAICYASQPLNRDGDANDLYNVFVRERAELAVTRRSRSEQLRRNTAAEFERVKQRSRFLRAALKLVSGTRAEKRFMYAAVRIAIQQELKAVRARAADDRRVLAHATRRLAWADWLQARAREGDVAALEQLRRRSAATKAHDEVQRALAGSSSSTRAQTLKGAVDNVTKSGVVIYRGALSGVRDDGHRLQVQGRVSDAVLAEALRVAANRYGTTLHVEGDAAFRQAVLDVVVARNIRVSFDDPELEARRRAQQTMETEDDGRARRPSRDTRSRQTGPAIASARQAPSQTDGLRNVRVRELVRDRGRAERLLSPYVPTDLAGRDRQDHQALRRAAGTARRVSSGPPPSRRGRLQSLSSLNPLASRTPAKPTHRSTLPNKGAHADNLEGPRPVRPRTSLPSLEALADPKRTLRVQVTLAAAVERYISEREAKRVRGTADVLPHVSFDGRGGEFTFVGRRNVDGHALVLVRDSSKVIVLPAPAHSEGLRSGDRVTLSADGQITGHTRGSRR